ncbi:glycosyltransferase family 4 protein [Salinicoccus sp. Marseille-QA3877]
MKMIQGVTSYLTVVFIKDQVDFIRDNGYEVKVVCNKDFESPYEGLEVEHIPFEREISPFKDIKTLFQLSKYLRKENPDIIHFSTPKAGLLGMTAGFICGIRTRIYMIRGLRLETVTGLKKMILNTTEKIACTFSTHVMVISDSMEHEVIRRNLTRKSKIVRIGRGSSSGIDLNRFNPSNIDDQHLNGLQEKLEIHDKDFIIGYAGRLTKDKGIDLLIESFQKLYKVNGGLKLLLIGDFESSDPLKQENADLIHQHRDIIYVPYTDGMDYYYSLMDLFILPTYREGFSNVSIEAQSMGVPVVTFDSTGASDTVEHGKTGLITESKSVDGLVKAIDELMKNDAKRKEMASVSREFIAENFDRDIMHRKFLDFYDSICKQGDENAEKDQNIQST